VSYNSDETAVKMKSSIEAQNGGSKEYEQCSTHSEVKVVKYKVLLAQ
jgi:hypothetical protein